MTPMELSNWGTLMVSILFGVVLFALFCGSGGWH